MVLHCLCVLILYFIDDGLLDHDEFENAPFDFRGKSISANNCGYNSVCVCGITMPP